MNFSEFVSTLNDSNTHPALRAKLQTFTTACNSNSGRNGGCVLQDAKVVSSELIVIVLFRYVYNTGGGVARYSQLHVFWRNSHERHEWQYVDAYDGSRDDRRQMILSIGDVQPKQDGDKLFVKIECVPPERFEHWTTSLITSSEPLPEVDSEATATIHDVAETKQKLMKAIEASILPFTPLITSLYESPQTGTVALIVTYDNTKAQPTEYIEWTEIWVGTPEGFAQKDRWVSSESNVYFGEVVEEGDQIIIHRGGVETSHWGIQVPFKDLIFTKSQLSAYSV